MSHKSLDKSVFMQYDEFKRKTKELFMRVDRRFWWPEDQEELKKTMELLRADSRFFEIIQEFFHRPQMQGNELAYELQVLAEELMETYVKKLIEEKRAQLDELEKKELDPHETHLGI